MKMSKPAAMVEDLKYTIRDSLGGSTGKISPWNGRMTEHPYSSPLFFFFFFFFCI